MLIPKKFMIVFLSLYALSFFGMDENTKNHIKNYHSLDVFKSFKCQHQIKNKHTGVSSLEIGTQHDRKTIFPEVDNKKKYKNDVSSLVSDFDQSGVLLFIKKQKDCKKIEYKELQGKQPFVTAIVKNADNSIKTAYPILRYISLKELANKKDDEPIYLGTLVDKDNNSKEISSTVENIKKASEQGFCLASDVSMKTGETKSLVDISKSFNDSLFYGKLQKNGSILVETDQK